MLRDPRALLWDICRAADAVTDFTRRKTIEDYKADRLLRSAVERQLTIVGEAVAQLSRLTPDLAQRVPDQIRVIALRNVLSAVSYPGAARCAYLPLTGRLALQRRGATE
jgi:uncharacterized protein with HEPN domain